MLTDWIIYGGGGHARVIAETIKLTGEQVIAYFDDNKSLTVISDIPVCTYNENVGLIAKMVIGIGNNERRREMALHTSHHFGTLIHPQAIIADNVRIGKGSVILAGAVIQPGVVIGEHVIINANVTVDHDVSIGSFSSIYPNAYIGGGAKIGVGVTIDACTAVPKLTEVPSALKPLGVMELDLF